jgi:uncharacterized small protein (DUF1192 family)
MSDELAMLRKQLGECYGGYQTLEKEVASLKAEVERLQAALAVKGEYGYSQEVVDALTAERDAAKIEIQRLRADAAKLAKLAEILAEYRAGTRPFPMYGELAVLLRG